MFYTSLAFLVFLILTGLVYFLVPKKARWYILLAASCVFYAINSKFLSVFVILSTAVIFISARLIDKKNAYFKEQKASLSKEERKVLKAQLNKSKKLISALAVILNLGILIVLKYSGFLVGTANSVISLFGTDFQFNIIKFVLPLGISYYTLTGISYVADVFRGSISAERNPLKLLLFLIYFPHIVEGPFARYGELSKTLYNGEGFNFDRFVSGSMKVLYGFAKKLIIADRAGILVNTIFKDYQSYSGTTIILGAALYTFQIYAEFSGCMDIAGGISEIFGIKIAENFRQPFFSKSIDEFWRRWHITLGEWLRDYVFYPITFSPRMKKFSDKTREKLGEYYGTLVPAIIALFCVWFSNGFWHGASWKYICYGLYYYILMMIGKLILPMTDKLYNKLHISRTSKGYGIFAVIRTNIIVLIGMLVFRSHDLTQSFKMLGSVIGGSLIPVSRCEGFTQYDIIVLLVGFAVLLAVGILKEKNKDIVKYLTKNMIVAWLILLLLCLLLVVFGIYSQGSGSSPFIYGQF